MHQGCRFLVWPNLKPRGPFGRDFPIEVIAQESMQLSQVSSFLEALHLRNYLERHNRLPTIWLAGLHKGGDT